MALASRSVVQLCRPTFPVRMCETLCSRLAKPVALGALLVSAAFGQQQGTMAPVIPQRGEMHLPANTRVVKGVVNDANGAPVPGAIVLLKDSKTLQIRSYIAKNDGSYQFYGLSSDVNYQVRAQAGGLTSPEKLISVFDSHKLIKLNLKLKDKKKNAKG